MLRVYVCEDNEMQRKLVTEIIEKIILIENLDMKVEKSSKDPYEILETVKKNPSTSLYFLDVDLGTDINGIALAEKIRDYDPRGFVVFITTHAEMSYLTFIYQVEAMDYIIKDDRGGLKNRIHQCILKAEKRYSSQSKEESKLFSIKSEDKIINVEYKDILFFETSENIHKIRLHCINRQVEFYGKMKEVEDMLDERFVRCHRSFIVNKENIDQIDKTNRIIYMVNGEECYASVNGIKEL